MTESFTDSASSGSFKEYFGLQRTTNSYPIVSPFTLSLSLLPSSEKIANQLGIPVGCYFTPFIENKDELSRSNDVINNSNSDDVIARCSQCAGYINPYIDISSSAWYCSICGTRNNFPDYKNSRYRQSERKILPELNENLIDIPVLFRSIEGCPDNLNGKKFVSIDERPLVHILLVEEDMNIDCLQAVVDSITESIDNIHPDLSIILVSFSYKVNIYRFSQSNPLIQSINLIITNERNILKSVDSISDLLLLDDIQYKDCKLMLTTSLSSCVDFINSRQQLRTVDKRKCFSSALNCIIDQLDETVEFKLSSEIRLKLFHCVIESIYCWLNNSYTSSVSSQEIEYVKYNYDDVIDLEVQTNLSEIVKIDNNTESNTSVNITGTLSSSISNMLSTFSQIFLGGTDDEIANNSAPITGISKKSLPDIKPNDRCTSIIIHSFISSQEVDFSQNSSYMLKEFEDLSNRLTYISVTINIYEVSSFQSNQRTSNLSILYPLVSNTGGKLYRFILGSNINHEKYRLTETICRSFTNPIASRCICKIRLTPGLYISEDSIPGFVKHDNSNSYKGIYMMSSCDKDRSIPIQLRYFETTSYYSDTSNSQALIIQFAMTYETLEEGDEIYSIDEPIADNSNIINNYENSTIDLLHLNEHIKIKDDLIDHIKVKQGRTSNDNSFITYKDRYNRGIHYNFKKKLNVVRRFRVITAVAECVHSIPRLIHSMNSNCVAALISNTIIQKYLKSFDYSEAVNEIILWLTTFLASTSYLAVNHSSNGIKQTIDNEKIMESLEGIAQFNKVKELLKLLYGFTNLLHQYKSSIISKDELIYIILNFSTMDPYYSQRILYPTILPVTSISYFKSYQSKNESNEQVQSFDNYFSTYILSYLSHPMTLKRESIILNNSELYIIDRGYDIILYRTINNSALSETIPSAVKQNTININLDLPFHSSNIVEPPKKHVMRPKESDSYIIRSSYWLPNAIISRMYLSPIILKTVFIQSGTQDAVLMDTVLIEDHCIDVSTEANKEIQWNNYNEYLKFLLRKTFDEYYNS